MAFPAGKNIGLIVSSHSSGISGVESDAKRLVPDGKFLSPSLWIKSAQTSNAKYMLENWLLDIKYNDVATAMSPIAVDNPCRYTVHNLSGVLISKNTETLDNLANGIYIVNGKKYLSNKH